MELINAAQDGDLSEVQRLINQGPGEAGIHFQNDRALIVAAYHGSVPIVEYLVDHGSSSSAGDIHAQNDLSFISAASNGHLSVVEFLPA